jgi:ubiquinone/menaquinone biosynthesis C-methylase UbiE
MRLKDLQIFLHDRVRQLRRLWDPNFKERKVLDIGSGHRPHIEATHLVDLYLTDDRERGKKLKRVGKTLIQADVEALPFKDKVFDYVYASHVLEHTVDPVEACKELMRVGKAGYIETPDPFFEQGYGYPNKERGWSFHRWFVWVDADRTLIFERKTEESGDQYCNCRYASFVRKIYAKLSDLNKLHKVLQRECNYTCFEWAEKFEYRVIAERNRNSETEVISNQRISH